MPDRRFSDDDAGRIIKTSKRLAAIRQIQAAIAHFKREEYECAISLAAAAEGLLPQTKEPHIFTLLRASEHFKEHDCNLFINWLKHPTGPEEMFVPEFEVAIVIMRAISKLIAIYREGTEDMRAFGRWVFEAGHLPVPKIWQENSN